MMRIGSVSYTHLTFASEATEENHRFFEALPGIMKLRYNIRKVLLYLRIPVLSARRRKPGAKIRCTDEIKTGGFVWRFC